MKISAQKRPRNVFVNGFGVFAVSLLVTASAVYLYSPVIGSHADTTEKARVVTEVDSVVSLVLDTNDLNIRFSSLSSDGTFLSSPINATVTTNSQTGYELYFSSIDDSTDIVSLDVTNTDVIASDFSGTVTGSTMEKNRWGYSLDDTDFSKIPTSTNQAKVRDLNHFPSVAERTTPVYIGVKVSSDLTAGAYSKDVKFTAFAPEMPHLNKLVELTSMQDSNLWTYCAQSYTPTSSATMSATTMKFFGDYVPTATLTDLRDNNTYTVKKLPDGRCWMTDSLRTINMTLNSTTSDLPDGETFTIPASDVTSISSMNGDGLGAYYDSTYGSYYNFPTATAGFGTYDVLSKADSPKSICPKGWRLPTGGPTGEFKDMYNSGGYSYTTIQGVPGFTLSGTVYEGALDGQGEYGRFWSSTVEKNWTSYNFYVGDNSVNAESSYGKYNGYQVHCIAR